MEAMYRLSFGFTILCALANGTVMAEFQSQPRLDENSKLAHEQLIKKAGQGRIDLYFLGDSITRRWGCSDKAYADLYANWRSHFFGWNAGNFGWGGDTTRNVLWRIENGELDGVNPKVIVLLVGTNDIGGSVYDAVKGEAKVEEIVEGIEAILATCQSKAPQAKIVLTGVFARGDNASATPMVVSVNERLASLAAERGVRFVNINPQLADAEGVPLEGMTVDGLHLSVKGYDLWAEALKPHLTELLGPPAEQDLAPPPTGDPSAKK
jgi:lysophospholipase L1-like esterase